MTGSDDDRELEDFLGRRSALHRRLAERDRDRSEPPQELDRLVLNKAREAIEVPGHAPIHRAPRWALPVSLAATVVLALAVVLNFARTQQGGYPVAASASPAANAVPADTEALRLAPPPVTGQKLAKERVDAFAAEPDALVAEARPEKPDESDAVMARDMRLADASKAPLVANNAAPKLETQAVREAMRSSAPGRAKARANGTVQMPPIVEAVSETETVSVTGTRRELSAMASASPMTSIDTDAAAQAASELPAAAPPPEATPLSQEAKRADPQAWRREIERLRAAGKNAEADREIAEFRKAFPGEAVPAASEPGPRP